MDVTTAALFVGGLVLLVIGGELLVKSASRLATIAGMSPLVIGLTVVAFGTSAPEFAASLGAALNGQGDLALGNVVGSNIFNVLFVLGACAVLLPLKVEQKLVRVDVPLMIGASVVVWLLATDGLVSRGEGVLLTAGLVSYVMFLLYESRSETTAIKDEYAQEFGKEASLSIRGGIASNLVSIVVALGLLVLGSRLLLGGATGFARAMGVSELVIGLSLVAAGTSLPEVVTSVLATIRGERDIAVGNVVGSNLFNLSGVLGVTAFVSGEGVRVSQAAWNFDLPVMVVTAVACVPIFFGDHRIARWEGWLFLGYYFAYTAYLILNATDHDALPAFSTTMLAFVVPLTAITLVVTSYGQYRRRGRE